MQKAKYGVIGEAGYREYQQRLLLIQWNGKAGRWPARRNVRFERFWRLVTQLPNSLAMGRASRNICLLLPPSAVVIYFR